jgi:type I restriction enzyme, S subunit
MAVKKGYKQTEVGVIPQDWNVTAFGSICKIERGKFTARPRNDPKYYGGDIPFIQTGDVSNSSGVVRKYSQTLNELGLRVSKRFPRGTLFFTIAANIGDVAITEFDTACPDSLVAISPSQIVYQRWLYHELKWNKSKFEIIASSNAQSNLNLEKIKSFLIPLPPTLVEQEAIASALSDADAWIESLEQLIAKKRQIKQGAMQELLTGKRRLPGFSGKWETKKLGCEIDLLTGFPFPSYGYSTSGVRLLRGSNIKRGVTDWSDEITQYWSGVSASLKEYVLRQGDIVIAMDGSLVGKSFAQLKPTDLPALLLQRVARIRSSTIQIGYLKEQVCSERFTTHCDSVKTVTAIPHISPKDIREFLIPVPPTLDEQLAIATVLSDMDTEIETLESKLAKAREIKQGMMQELLTGRIRLI